MRLQLLLLALAFCAISAQDDEFEDVFALKPSDALLDHMDTFTTNLYQELYKSYYGKNLLTSPFNAYIALAMVLRGSAQKGFFATGTFGDNAFIDVSFKQFFKDLSSEFNNTDEATLELANKIFLSDNSNVENDYIKVIQETFHSAVGKIDVSNPSVAAKTINDWVSEKTHEKIKNIVDPGSIDDRTRLHVVSALYFKSLWQYKFKVHPDIDFFTTKNTAVKVPSLYAKKRFFYGYLPNLKAQFVSIPYKKEDMEMVIIVPDEKDGLNAMEARLESFNYNELNLVGYHAKIELTMPKFKFESSFDLKGSLIKLGFGYLFDTPELSLMSKEALYISHITQKTFVEVNENGTEAAAATDIGIGVKSAVPEEPVTLVVDRPFLFMIRKASHVLFQGHVYDPLLH